MTHRERMLAAIRGEPTDQIPWAPRMDLWAIAHRARTDGDGLAALSTPQIADELGVACHAVRADYTQKREPMDLALRGLGIDNHPDYPFRVELCDLPLEFQYDDGLYQTLIRTPAGDVSMRLLMTSAMAAEGISLPFAQKYPICGPEDFERVALVFDHLQVIPTPEQYASFRERVGERGLAVASGPLGASPIHLLLHDVMAMEEFYVCYADDRAAMQALARRMEPLYEAMLSAVLDCEAEVIFWGANYDRDTTWPPFFEQEIVPWLKRIGERTRAAGKLLLTHTDGENQGLLDLYPTCGFDVAESVCPEPMSSFTLAQIRQGLGPARTVWGGVPCVVLLDDVTDERGFEQHMDRLFAELGAADHLILGVSDNVPPDVNMSRLHRIKDWIEAFGPVSPPTASKRT
ncbi:MAG: hypothetical protein QF785_09260 [Phycisphaeraceae bacterium]|nr:hypothetical protein [Phycisphaeraceae bacterium]